jgi:flavin-binding protein dodecin
MSNKVYKKIEITGASEVSLEDAIQGAVSKASKTIRNMRWFEVVETRGALEDGQVTQWQVTLKIGFGLDD